MFSSSKSSTAEDGKIVVLGGGTRETDKATTADA